MTTRDEPEPPGAPDAFGHAVHLAMRRMDIGFLWGLLRDLPATDAAAGRTDLPAPGVTQVLGYLAKHTH
jgi:hypothetical protein